MDGATETVITAACFSNNAANFSRQICRYLPKWSPHEIEKASSAISNSFSFSYLSTSSVVEISSLCFPSPI